MLPKDLPVREPVLLDWRKLDLSVLLKDIRRDCFDVLILGLDPIDLEDTEDLPPVLRLTEERGVLLGAERLVARSLFRLPPLDRPPWPCDFLPKTGSTNNIDAAAKITNHILILFLYLVATIVFSFL